MQPTIPTAHEFEQLTLLPAMQANSTPFIDVGGQSDRGKERSHNTDFFLTATLTRATILGPSSLAVSPGLPWTSSPQGKLLAVADGVTGTGMGDVASWAAVEDIAQYIGNDLPWVLELHEQDEQLLLDAIVTGLRRCQARVRREAEKYGYGERPVGTTLTMAYIVWPRLYIIHVGDSRAYLYRDGRLLRLSSDDTIAQRMIDAGFMSTKEGEESRYRHILTNTIGGDDDALEIEHHSMELRHGDQLLLCSDGLPRHLSDGDIQHHLRRAATASMCSSALVDAANDAGGSDNITAVVARVADSN